MISKLYVILAEEFYTSYKKRSKHRNNIEKQRDSGIQIEFGYGLDSETGKFQTASFKLWHVHQAQLYKSFKGFTEGSSAGKTAFTG
jgi:hypothetical protein